MKEANVVNLYIPIVVDELVHTDENPFCNSPDRPCHNDDNVEAYIDPYLDEGTMSNAEAFRMYFGR
jgi:hypothetical protein